jgi:hypothetical protein
MIEMHQEGEPPIEDLPAYQGSRTSWTALVLSAPALAITSLFLSLAGLTSIQVAVELGETRAFTHIGATNLTVLRWSTGVRLGIAALGLLSAILAALQIHDDEDLGEDEEDLALPGDPLWVRALSGAALLISIVAVLISAAAFIYTMATHDISRGL